MIKKSNGSDVFLMTFILSLVLFSHMKVAQDTTVLGISYFIAFVIGMCIGTKRHTHILYTINCCMTLVAWGLATQLDTIIPSILCVVIANASFIIDTHKKVDPVMQTIRMIGYQLALNGVYVASALPQVFVFGIAYPT